MFLLISVYIHAWWWWFQHYWQCHIFPFLLLLLNLNCWLDDRSSFLLRHDDVDVRVFRALNCVQDAVSYLSWGKSLFLSSLIYRIFLSNIHWLIHTWTLFTSCFSLLITILIDLTFFPIYDVYSLIYRTVLCFTLRWRLYLILLLFTLEKWSLVSFFCIFIRYVRYITEVDMAFIFI